MKCKNLGIIVILLYPNSTSSTQPADKAFFKPTKALYSKIIQTNRFFDSNFHITKQSFAAVIAKMLSLCSPSWVKSGFESTGIYPLDKTRVTIHNFESAFTESIQVDEPDSSFDSVVLPNKPDETKPYSRTSVADTFPTIVDCQSRVAINSECDKMSSCSAFDTFSAIVEGPHIEPSSHNSSLLSPQNSFYNDESNDATSYNSVLTQTIVSRYNDCEISISVPDVEFPISENPTVSQKATALKMVPLSQRSTLEINSQDSFNSEENKIQLDSIDMEPIPISTFKIQSSRFLMSTPLQKFTKIIGSKKIKEFEDAEFEKNLENAGKVLRGDTFELTKQLYSTYVMLREYEEFLKSPPTLQAPDPPKRKNVRNTPKKPFVITSQKWIDITQEEKNKKNNDLEEKENRKIKRQENKIKRENEKQNKKRKLTEMENEEVPKSKTNKPSFLGRM